MATGFAVFFCLISSVLLTGVTSLRCQTCFAMRGECRNEDMRLVECERDETYCLTLTTFATLTRPSLSFTSKSCARAEECNNGFYSMTSAQGKHSQANLFCCQSDGCNALPVPLPLREQLRPNGLVCSGSYTRGGDSLQAVQTVLCLGQETQCVNLNFTVNAFGAFREEGFFQGCGTKNVCLFPEGETRLVNGLLVVSIRRECTSSPLSFESTFLPE